MIDDDVLRSFDHYSPEDNERMYEVTAYAREHCPVTFTSSEPGYWIVTRYADARRVLLDPVTFTNGEGVTVFPRDPSLPPDIPVGLDPPAHKEYRQLLSRFFTRDAVRASVPRLHEIAAERLAGLLDAGAMEFVREFAAPYSFAAFAEVYLRVEDLGLLGDFIGAADRVVVENTEESYLGLMKLVGELLDRRRAAGVRDDSVISALENGRVGGEPIPPHMVTSCVCSLIAAGFETNVTQLATILVLTRRYPELIDTFAQRDWARRRLDELLRLQSPVAGLARTVAADTTIGTTKLRKGDKVIVHVASADRDEAHFGCADQLDFERPSRTTHLAFGAGIHRCLGAIFAEAVIGAGLHEFAAQARRIRVRGEISYSGGIVRRPREVHVTYERRP
ncbi:cytochrome P450 [Pseudonocardia eucalypti]|uniref:Cytochrome P450 n=1 Tax=Pseudonocardia eucalypti TaxID=648755 RepID=A0ABP9PRT6_9PSEU|nr:cytochrome P450 [Pseudonocardia eucalypti]